MKRIASLLLLLVAALSALLLSGCESVSDLLGKDKHEHSFTAENTDGAYLAFEATCTEAAKYHYSCECGEKNEETFSFGAPLGHKYGEGVLTKPTCTEKGYTSYTCFCGDVKIADEVEATGHKYGEGVVKEPTCTEDGHTTYTCFCGDVKIADKVIAKGHTYIEGATVEASCTEDGYTEFSCFCGHGKTETIKAKGHSYTDYKSNGDATCYEDGTKTAVCDNGCGESHTEIEKGSAGHVWENDLCHSCGVRYYSQGLSYDLNDTGDAYVVSGIGTCNDLIIVIPADLAGIPVVGIGTGAFSGASTITEVVMPDSILYVGDNAFYLCISIEIVFISKNVTSIGDSAFKGCESLENVTIPDSVTEIGDSAFSGCESLDEIIIPDNVTEIGSSAFEGCSSLSSVILGAGLEKIGDKAFYLCIKITIIIIPETVSYVGSNAFGGCTSLSYVLTKLLWDVWSLLEWAEDWLGGIEAEAYLGDSWIVAAPGIEADGGVILFKKWEVYKAATCLEDGILRRYAVNVADYYEEKVITALGHDIVKVGAKTPTCEEVGWDAYEYCTRCDKTTYVELPASGHGMVSVEAQAPSCTEDGWNAYSYCTKCGINDKVTVPALDHAYVSHDAKKVSCTEDGWDAYRTCERCDFNTQTVIPALGHKFENYVSNSDATCTEDGTLTAICENGCGEKHTKTDTDSAYGHKFENYVSNSDATCTADGTLTAVCENGCGAKHTKTDTDTAFGHDLAYVDASAPNCTDFGWKAYEYCKRCDHTTYEKIDALGHSYDAEGVCSVCGNRVSVGLTYKLNEGGASYTVTGLGNCLDTHVIIPEVYEGLPVTAIEQRAFYNKTSLMGVKIPESVTTIGEYAFAYCYALVNVSVPGSIQSIGRNVFTGSSSIAYNEYGNAYYFGNSDNLYLILAKATGTGITSCTVHSETKFILDSAFASCKSLTEIKVPDNVISIDYDAFKNCTALKSVVIGNGVKSLPEGLFYGCSNITSMTLPFVGDSAKTSSDEYQYPFGYIFGTASYNGSTAAQQTYYGNKTNYGTLGYLTKAYYIPSKLTSVTITGGEITYGAFYNCKTLTDVIIQGENTAVRQYAFYYCTGLKNLVIGEGISRIDGGALIGCGYLENLTIPFVGESAEETSASGSTLFGYIFGGSSYTNSTGVLQYYNASSSYRTTYYLPANLRTVTVTGGNLKYGAFYGCSRISKITLSGDIGMISARAFYNCTGLTSIEMLGNVGKIEANAFEGCKYLANVYAGSLEDWCGIEFGGIAATPLYYGGKLYINGELLTELTVPEGITSVGDYAFYGNKNLTSVVLPEGVTSIGNYAFYGCENITSITLPDSLVSIGDYAFYGLANLTDIDIPEAVTYIGMYAFYNCSKIESFRIPEGVTSIGAYAFYGCSALTSINIPEAVTEIGGHAFYGCSALTSINIPDGVTAIRYGVFQDCSSLANVNIPDGVTSIGEYAFSGCSSLTSIVIPEGVTSISYYAFQRCSKLTEMVIPSSVTSIAQEIFSGCSSLTSVTIPFVGANADGTEVSYTTKFSYLFSTNVPANLTSVTVTGGNILSGAFDNCPNITDIFLTDGVKKVEKGAFNGCTSLKYNEYEGGYYLGTKENPYLVLVYTEGNEKTYVIHEDTEIISGEAFYEKTMLQSIVIPKNVKAIGTDAFCGCEILFKVTNLSDIDIKILSSSNGYVANYAKIVIDKNGNKSYKNGITEFDFVDSPENYLFTKENGNYVLVKYYGSETDLTLPSDINGNAYAISDAVFYGRTDLTSVVIPEGVTSIGIEAFYGCTSLTSVSISGTVTSIGTEAFYNCKKITSLVIPDSVSSIGNNAFGNCSSLKTLVIGKGVKNIGKNVLAGCTSLESLTVPFIGAKFNETAASANTLLGYFFTQSSYGNDSQRQYYDTIYYVYSNIPATLKNVTVTGGKIFYGAFYNCTNVESITLCDEVTLIGNSAFYNCKALSDITVGDGVASIGSRAFYNCGNIENLYLGRGVTEFYSEAVYNASINNLYIDDLAAWCGVKFGTSYTNPITYANNVYFDGVIITDLVIPDSVSVLNDYAFCGLDSITDVTIHSGVKSIGNYTFTRCTGLKNIVFADGLESIGTYAFDSCESLTDITLPNSLTSMGKYAFARCTSLTDITLSDALTSISEYAFAYCTSLANLEVPSTVTAIVANAFAGCSGLESITLPFIGTSVSPSDNCFYPLGIIFGTTAYTGGEATSQTYNRASSTSTVTYYIPSKLRSVTVTGGNIYRGAFENCKNITSITLPESLTSIGYRALYNTGIVRITIPSAVTSIQSGVFEECTKLFEVTNLSALNMTIGSTANGYASYYAKVLIDKDGNKTYRDGITEFEIVGIVDSCLFIKENGKYVLCAYVGADENVILPSDINGSTYEIGAKAFYLLTGVKKVTIPAGVTVIADRAFYGCTALESATLPEGLETIGNYAFCNCNLLQTLNIPTGVKTIGSYAFSGCTALESLTLPEGLETIGSYAFYNCNLLKVLTVPIGVKTIGDRAFYECRSLQELTIPGSVETIGDYAFYYCSNITSLTIENGVSVIGSYAFCSLSSLKSLTIPDSVTSIGSYAFSNCKALTDIVIPSSVTEIGQGAFTACVALESITLPFIGQKASPAENEYKYPFGYIFGTVEYLNCVATQQTYRTTGVSSVTTTTYYIPTSLKTVVITGGEVVYGAFQNCKNLTSITLPDTATSIGENAFYNCTALTALSLPSAVTVIGKNAFYGCTALQFNEYDNAYYLGSEANPYLMLWKAKTTSITSCEIHSDTKFIADNAFNSCSALTSIAIPAGIKSIGAYAFRYCSGLTSMTVPDGVESIGDYAFESCSFMTKIELPDSVTYMGSYAFKSSAIESIRIPLGVKQIRERTFEGCYYLTEIIWHDGVEIIDSYAFQNCESLTTVEIPKGVYCVWNYAFGSCDSLTRIVISGSITAMGECAFYNNPSLTTVIIKSGTTTIGYGAFAQCTNLKTVVLPDTLTSVAEMAFYYSNNIKSVYFGGTASQWKISIGSYNTTLTNAARYYYSDSQPTESGNYWHYDANGDPVAW